MSKHRPGPWRVKKESNGSILIIGVCRVTFNRLSQEDTESAVANARLISAAPEMLEALQAVLGRGFLENKYPASQDYVSKSAIAKVRAAIRKAERPE